MSPKTATKPAKSEDVEDEVDLEELAEDDEEETPAKAKASAVTFGVADLCAVLSKKLGKEYKPKDLRTLIRKMAREDNARVDREIIPGNKSRYDWPLGLEDPEVKRIVKAVTGGELEAGRREALEKLKANKAAKQAAEKGSGKTSTKASKKSAPVDDDDEAEITEDLEDLDED